MSKLDTLSVIRENTRHYPSLKLARADVIGRYLLNYDSPAIELDGKDRIYETIKFSRSRAKMVPALQRSSIPRLRARQLIQTHRALHQQRERGISRSWKAEAACYESLHLTRKDDAVKVLLTLPIQLLKKNGFDLGVKSSNGLVSFNLKFSQNGITASVGYIADKGVTTSPAIEIREVRDLMEGYHTVRVYDPDEERYVDREEPIIIRGSCTEHWDGRSYKAVLHQELRTQDIKLDQADFAKLAKIVAVRFKGDASVAAFLQIIRPVAKAR